MAATESDPRLADVDNLVADYRSSIWLRDNGLLPSQWGLPNHEIEFIRTHSIALRIFNSPSFVYDFSLYPSLNNGVLYLVFFDADLVVRHRLTKKEATAVILHEIGHVTNPNGKRIGDEHDADGYALRCGFGLHLTSALEKLKSLELSYFNTDEMAGRIERLNGIRKG